MKRVGRRRTGHSIDLLFALILFAVFAVSSMLIVLTGAKNYASIAAGMNEADHAMVLSYFKEKLRMSREPGAAEIGDDQHLILKETRDQDVYCTWIYLEDGTLMEAFLPEGRIPIEGTGSEIAKLEQLELTWQSSDLLEIRVTDGEGKSGTGYFSF